MEWTLRQEKYCQEIVRLMWGDTAADARIKAMKAAGYEGNNKTLYANAKRLETFPHIKARIAHLMQQAAEMACIDASWAMTTLKQLVDANVLDYLQPDGTIDVKKIARAQAAKLAELSIERGTMRTIGRGRNKKRVEVGARVKIKLHSKIEAINTLARIAGWGRSSDDDPSKLMVETLKHLVQKSYDPVIEARAIKQIEAERVKE
jgi:hypothetical protein